MYCSKYSHCKLVRELKLQSLRRKDILQLQSFQFEASAKNKKLETTTTLKRLKLMLPARVSPVKQCSRAAMSGRKDNTSRLKRRFRGLHSVFGTELDHPVGPPVCCTDTDIYAHTRTAKRTHAEFG